MAKDSYWFKHDSTAGRGTRMRKMAFIHGHWGKGIYWDVIEILRDQDGYTFEKDETSLQMLCELIGCNDVSKFMNWFNDCVRLDLLQTKGNIFFSYVLCQNMNKWETTKLAGIQSGIKRNERKHERNVNETGTKARTKREHKIIEDKIIEEKNEIFMDEKYQLPYEIKNGEKIVGSDNARKMGGMSVHAIKIHCANLGIEYGGEYGI